MQQNPSSSSTRRSPPRLGLQRQPFSFTVMRNPRSVVNEDEDEDEEKGEGTQMPEDLGNRTDPDDPATSPIRELAQGTSNFAHQALVRVPPLAPSPKSSKRAYTVMERFGDIFGTGISSQSRDTPSHHNSTVVEAMLKASQSRESLSANPPGASETISKAPPSPERDLLSQQGQRFGLDEMTVYEIKDTADRFSPRAEVPPISEGDQSEHEGPSVVQSKPLVAPHPTDISNRFTGDSMVIYKTEKTELQRQPSDAHPTMRDRAPGATAGNNVSGPEDRFKGDTMILHSTNSGPGTSSEIRPTLPQDPSAFNLISAQTVASGNSTSSKCLGALAKSRNPQNNSNGHPQGPCSPLLTTAPTHTHPSHHPRPSHTAGKETHPPHTGRPSSLSIRHHPTGTSNRFAGDSMVVYNAQERHDQSPDRFEGDIMELVSPGDEHSEGQNTSGASQVRSHVELRIEAMDTSPDGRFGGDQMEVFRESTLDKSGEKDVFDEEYGSGLYRQRFPLTSTGTRLFLPPGFQVDTPPHLNNSSPTLQTAAEPEIRSDIEMADINDVWPGITDLLNNAATNIHDLRLSELAHFHEGEGRGHVRKFLRRHSAGHPIQRGGDAKELSGAIREALYTLLKVSEQPGGSLPPGPLPEIAFPTRDNFYIKWRHTMKRSRFNSAAVDIVMGWMEEHYEEFFRRFSRVHVRTRVVRHLEYLWRKKRREGWTDAELHRYHQRAARYSRKASIDPNALISRPLPLPAHASPFYSWPRIPGKHLQAAAETTLRTLATTGTSGLQPTLERRLPESILTSPDLIPRPTSHVTSQASRSARTMDLPIVSHHSSGTFISSRLGTPQLPNLPNLHPLPDSRRLSKWKPAREVTFNMRGREDTGTGQVYEEHSSMVRQQSEASDRKNRKQQPQNQKGQTREPNALLLRLEESDGELEVRSPTTIRPQTRQATMRTSERYREDEEKDDDTQ
ncbi:hypothetical protein FRC05_005942 [Tulasnella sp. 425]|nr:hypothetical protein FRC05_005942 [Tulasnella sp. 425]